MKPEQNRALSDEAAALLMSTLFELATSLEKDQPITARNLSTPMNRGFPEPSAATERL